MTDEELDARIDAALERRLAKAREDAKAKGAERLAAIRSKAEAKAQIEERSRKAQATNRRRLEQRDASPSVRLGGLARKGFETIGQEFDGVTVTPSDDGRFLVLAGDRDRLRDVGVALVKAADDGGDSAEVFRRAAKAVASAVGVELSALRAA